VDRSGKQALIETLHQTLGTANLVVVTRQSGLTVAEVSDLRRKMRAAGAGYKVAKNRLAQRALKGTKYEGLDKLLKGPTALAYSSDPVAAQVAVAYATSNDKLKIVGGAMGARSSALMGSGPLPCRRWTNCAPSWSACCRRRGEDRHGGRHLPDNWPRVRELMQEERDGVTVAFKPQRTKRVENESLGRRKWLICRNWLMSCRS
jgi:hypothetical protein